jgi:two-component system phosphate regulon response regulator PhoB
MPPTILIVDDDPDLVDLLVLTLESEGARLVSAGDAESALALCRAERPDLVLLDWNMPGRSGLDICRDLRAEPDPKLRQVPVLLLTAETDAKRAEGLAAGASDYVTKPFTPADIRARVRAWLSGSAAPGAS